MAFDAMRLGLTSQTTLPLRISHVVGMRPKKEMSRVDAEHVVAVMADEQITTCDRPVSDDPTGS